jgi:tetratricopeptide (TPR) repeat protein
VSGYFKGYSIGLAVFVLAALAFGSAAVARAEDPVIISRKQKLEKAKDYFSLGQMFIKEGDYASANAEFAKAELMLQESAINLPEEETPEKTGTKETAASEKKQVEKAMSYYLEEIKKETSNPDYYYNLGIDYLNKGQFVQAEESFKLAINLNPLDKDACYNLAVLYENYLGNKEKSIKYYQQYLNIAPDAPDSQQVLSWVKALKEADGAK